MVCSHGQGGEGQGRRQKSFQGERGGPTENYRKLALPGGGGQRKKDREIAKNTEK